MTLTSGIGSGSRTAAYGSRLTILCDDNVCVRTPVLVDMLHSLLDTVHHLNAALQVPILCAQRFHFRRAECQVRCKPWASVNLHLQYPKHFVMLTIFPLLIKLPFNPQDSFCSSCSPPPHPAWGKGEWVGSWTVLSCWLGLTHICESEVLCIQCQKNKATL